MQIESINLGDHFVRRDGNKIHVTGMSCGFDEAASLWETSIRYDLVNPKDEDLSVRGHTLKARMFVQMIQQPANGFVTHVQANTDAEELSFEQLGFGSKSTTGADGSNGAAKSELDIIAMDFIKYASRYGLDPSDLGKRIGLNGNKKKKYKIVGAKPLDARYPIRISGPRGGVYRISAQRAVEGLKA